MPMQDMQQPYPLAETGFDEQSARFSPDGRWLVYSSDESGKLDVYVQSFAAPHNKVLLSSGGGQAPGWSRGKKVHYLTLDWKVMEVPLKTGTQIEVGTPRFLFAVPKGSDFDVWTGGRFLLLESNEQSAEPATAVLNWDTAVGLRK
jgi:hypothetical protein